MKVPWYIVILAIVFTISLTWFGSTKHYDFMAPNGTPLPPEDFGADLLSGTPTIDSKFSSQPKIDAEAPKPYLSHSDHDSLILDSDLGDLESSPSLESYRDFAQLEGATRLLDLSSKLQALGQSQRTMLALERVIDSTSASRTELEQARAGIRAISPTLPRWNIDPSHERPIFLHLIYTHTIPESLKLAALDIATKIREASSHQIEVIPKFTRRAQTNTSPSITLALSATSNIPKETPILILSSVLKENINVTDELAKAVFRMVRGRLSEIGYPTPDTSSPNDLSEGMTRLMWHEYAHLLNPAATLQSLPAPTQKELNDD